MVSITVRENLVKQKLAACEHLQPDFEASFRFIQDVHGQRRFATFPLAETIHYLHALWVCECKDRLLSVARGPGRYKDFFGLHLLQKWQEGDTASVIAFLQQKLNDLPFANLTYQLQEALKLHRSDTTVQRLASGRMTMLHRGMNFLHAIEAIIALPELQLMQEVQTLCKQFGHSPEQIRQQLADGDDPLYAYLPHRLLAERNMLIMNAMGVQTAPHREVETESSEEPVEKPKNIKKPSPPFAEQTIDGYQEHIYVEPPASQQNG